MKVLIKSVIFFYLAQQERIFDNYIKECRDINYSSVLRAFLKKLFKIDTSPYFPLFQKHPFYRQVSLVSIEDTFLYLNEEGFTHDSILHVIFVLLYPRYYGNTRH